MVIACTVCHPIQSRHAFTAIPFYPPVLFTVILVVFVGPSYLQQFCQNAVNSLFSPFILYDIAMEVACYQTRNNQAQLQSVFRAPMLQSLMQRCLQM